MYSSRGHGRDFKAHTHGPADTTEDKPPARNPEHQGTCSENLSLDRDNSCRGRAGCEHRQASRAPRQGHGHGHSHAGQLLPHPPSLG